MLDQNPQVREDRVSEYLEFEKKMREQGLQVGPRYQVTSPLGPLESERQKTSASTQKIRK